ncbi:MAG: efflux RND transporter periplasmic adaptor subunit [Pacificimonas sp.]
MSSYRKFISTITAFAVLSACSSEPEATVPRTVETVIAGEADTSRLRTFPATLRADQRGALGFQTGGMVARVNVEIGDRFRRGDALAALDPQQQRLAHDAARAGVSEAEAEAEDARLDLNRKNALAGTGAVAASVIDAARRRSDQAAARVRSLRAEAGRAEDTLGDTTLRAPYAGIVTRRLAEPSEVVSVGQAVLEVSALNSELEAVASVPGAMRKTFAKGTRHSFRASGADVPLAAIVQQIDGAASTAGLFEVQLTVPNARESGLTVGARGDIVGQSNSARDIGAGIVVPATALQPVGENTARVFVVDPKGSIVSTRTVVVAGLGDDGAVISSGLQLGDVVVAKGAGLLRPGETVRTTTGVRRFNQ